MSYYCGMSWLIVCVTILMSGTFVITYTMSVMLNHVEYDFPYMSDTGTFPPESCVFGQLLNIAAVFVGMTIYVRYCQVSEHLSDSQHRLRLANNVALILGFISAFGVSVVANFQVTNVVSIHIIGALMAFGVGNVYLWMQGVMSYWLIRTTPPLNGKAVFFVRIVCCILSLVAFIVSFVFGMYGSMDVPGSNSYRNVSAAAEWAMALLFLVLFATFYGEFRRMRIRAPLELKTDWQCTVTASVIAA